MNSAHDNERPARYGCLERRADAESVMSGRIHPEVHERYKQHLRSCSDCRRAHNTLLALYRGPQLPPGPTSNGQDREFAAILQRVAEERPTPRHQQALLTAGVGSLTAIAAVLTLNIFSVQLLPAQLSSAGLTGKALSESSSRAEGIDSQDALAANRVRIEHRAQVDYGRIIGGHANLLDAEDQAVVTNTFEVGTRFHIPGDQSLQARFIGKILTNFGSQVDATWTAAEPDLIELELDRGIVATRYDRLHGDPVLKIQTPTAIVKVIGTVFTVEVEDDGDTTVAVLRGKVEVLEPGSERVITEIAAGYRFDVASSTFSDVGRAEIMAALPLTEAALAANSELSASAGQLPDHVPSSWVVPGLPSDPALRSLDNLIPRRPAAKRYARGAQRLSDEELFNTLIAPLAPVSDDDGEELLFELMQRDFERTRRKELRAKLRRCGDYYQSPETRYMAARCITEFMNRHGDEADVAEGWLLYGILRMDYANDYRVAMSAFRKFLAASPNHHEAELARYRLWLASTESGQIADAELRGREYLRRYPNGKYVGKILQRFPTLIDEL